MRATRVNAHDLDALRRYDTCTVANAIETFDVRPRTAGFASVDFGVPVVVGGLEIRPGDLIHADLHGVQVIPEELVRAIPAAAEEIIAKERAIIALCQSPHFALDELKRMQP